MTRQGFDALTGSELILLLFPCHCALFSLHALSSILDKFATWWLLFPFLVSSQLSSLPVQTWSLFWSILSSFSSSYFLSLVTFFPHTVVKVDIYSRCLTGHSDRERCEYTLSTTATEKGCRKYINLFARLISHHIYPECILVNGWHLFWIFTYLQVENVWTSICDNCSLRWSF